MSDLVKWALLAVLIVTVIVAVVSFVTEADILSAFNLAVSSIGSGVSVIAPYLKTGRELLNNFFVPQILTAALYIYFFGWIARIAISLSSLVLRFIYK